MAYIILRSGQYYYNRRVPKKFRDFDGRDVIRISLETDSYSDAVKKSVRLNDEIENYWKKLIISGETYQASQFKRITELARIHGFAYRENTGLAKTASLSELAQRFSVLENRANNKDLVAAVLGGVAQPALTLSNALKHFWEISKSRLIHKSQDQQRKWKNPRIKAVSNFINIIGDKDIYTVTRDDVLRFRDWWIERIETENKNAGSANKDLIHLKNVVETVSENDGLKIDTTHLFRKIILKERFSQARVPLKSEEIISILKSPELDKLNPDAKWFLYAAAETGARPSEIVGLLPEDIFLDADIPYIHIKDRPDKTLKTPHSERMIPLVGYALQAFKEMPNGFKRYRDKPDNLSNYLNKFLRNKGLLLSKKHSVYSLRHSFQDRILSINAPDRVQADLMGHKFERPVYGDGATLEQKRDWMMKIKLCKQ